MDEKKQTNKVATKRKKGGLVPWEQEERVDFRGRSWAQNRWVHVCTKCDETFMSKKTLRLHKAQEHSY